MGSGRSGLYSSLAQSVSGRASISIPVSTITHASIGEYPKNAKKLKSGCHSQAGIEELKRRGIRFKIEKTLKNGVRVGYVKDHTHKMKRKSGGQMWFPKNWTEGDIKKAGMAVLKAHKGKIKNGSMVTGWYNKVRVGIIIGDGKIKTIFPTYEQE